jgi:zinc transport system substrate-binding protein
MVKKRAIILATLSLLLTNPAWAITVLSSIKPIQMITHELVAGVGEAEVLLDNNTSPHDYALRPSDMKKMHSADLVIWFGNELEPFMSKVLESIDSDHILTISQFDNINLAHFDEDHKDDGHNHGTLDPHFWLGQKTTLGVAQVIVEKLSQIDAANASHYQQNLVRFNAAMEQTALAISARLTPFNMSPYYVFHDAYGYFERDYQLNNLGHFTVSPERKPGAKTLITIKNALTATPGVCVFAEPQFQPAVITSVMRGTSSKLGTLDPLGSNISVGALSYFELLNQLASEFESCFKAKE